MSGADREVEAADREHRRRMADRLEQEVPGIFTDRHRAAGIADILTTIRSSAPEEAPAPEVQLPAKSAKVAGGGSVNHYHLPGGGMLTYTEAGGRVTVEVRDGYRRMVLQASVPDTGEARARRA